MKTVFLFLFAASVLVSANAFATSSNADCLRDAKKVARALMLVNHPEMAKYRITSAIVPRNDPTDPNDTMNIFVNYWAPHFDENAVISYTALAIPSGGAKCGGIVSVTENYD